MREIKFRAWDTKKMYYPDSLMFDGKGIVSNAWQHCNLPDDVSIVSGANFLKRDLHLMQCTGLIDMDGVDIYEGDLVRVFNTITGSVTAPKVVEWNGETARCNGLSLNGSARVMKVIGNIYENEELGKP